MRQINIFGEVEIIKDEQPQQKKLLKEVEKLEEPKNQITIFDIINDTENERN